MCLLFMAHACSCEDLLNVCPLEDPVSPRRYASWSLLQMGRGSRGVTNLSDPEEGSIGAPLRGSGGISCLANPGGHCLTGGCEAWRGSTQCKEDHCVCSAASCAGSDGRCYEKGKGTTSGNSANTSQRLGEYMIRNVRFPKHYLYFSRLSSMPGVAENPGRSGNFTLWRLPDGGLILESVAFPGYLLSIAHTMRNDEEDPNAHTVTSIVASAQPVARDGEDENAVPGLAVRLHLAPKRNWIFHLSKGKQVMISGVEHFDYFLHVPQRSWTVHAFKHDPGLGGYWIFEPDLPFNLTEYDGPTCRVDCGRAGGRSSAMLVGMLLMIRALLCSAT